MFQLTLTKYGHTVVEARNGKEGLKLFSDTPVDLVITDLVMPESDGFELLHELRKQQPQVKIIVISGGLKGDIENFLTMARRLGAGQALAKPFSNDELNVAINTLLSAEPLPLPPL